jgi:hypothetical protein
MTHGDWLAFLSGDLEEGRRTSMAKHINECPECRQEAGELRRVLGGTDTVRGEIQDVLRSVDWEALPGRITDYVYAKAKKPEPVSSVSRFRLWLGQAGLKPIVAWVCLGVIIGALGMYLVLKNSGPQPVTDRSQGFFASKEFLDRAELEMARRETLSYLEKSQYVLLDVLGSPQGGSAVRTPFSTGQAKELLAKKKYLNAELDKFQMSKAKAICDQIEILFLELSQISERLPQAELKNIQKLIQERQLVLKINLVKKELESEV